MSDQDSSSTSLGAIARKRRLAREAAEQQAQQTHAPVNSQAPSSVSNAPWAQYAQAAPEVESQTNQSAQQVNLYWSQTSVKQIFDYILHGTYKKGENARTSGEAVISCPNPAHPDRNPSAAMNLDSGLWTCYKCNFSGTDKLAMAGIFWGYPVPIRSGVSDAWDIKKRAVRELYGYDYDVERIKETTPPVSPALQSTPSSQPVSPQDTTGLTDEEVQAQTAWNALVERRARETAIRLEGDRIARMRLSQALFTPPEFSSLDLELQVPDPAVDWCIEELCAVGSNTTITAGFKVGKTTFVMNLIKALADQTPFLGTHEVKELSGKIAFLNFEVEGDTVRSEFRKMGIHNTSRIVHMPLRGRVFNLLDDIVFEWAVNNFKQQGVEVLILDPYSGAFYGDENSNTDVNMFTKRLDNLKELSGVVDLFMPVHTGRQVEEGKERARGAARIDDWTDNRWVLARSADTRYFKAEGRKGVDFPEQELVFDYRSNTLSMGTAGGRKRSKTTDVSSEVLAFIRANPGCGVRDIRAGVSAKGQDVSNALKKLVANVDIETRSGPNRSILHYIQGTAPFLGVTP